MFCAECGTKNEKGAKFCESCGAKLVEEKKETKKVSNNKSTNKDNSNAKTGMSKNNKIILGIIAAVVVVLVILYSVISNKLSPKAIAEDYFLAVTNYDAEKLYQYLDVDSSEFTTKEVFIKIMEKDLKDEDKKKVANYTVGAVKKDLTGLSATVTVTYMVDGKKDSDTVDVTLVKQKNKKYGIFDNWKVSMDNLDTTDDFEIKVLKGSKVKIEGVSVDKKYLDKDKSDDTYDVYKMPAMFNTTYSTTITLPMGFDVEDNIRVSKYSNSYSYYFSESNLPNKVKKQITSTIKTGLQTLYDGAKDGKTFADIKKSFEFKGSDLSDLEKAYNSLVRGLDGDGLTSINFTDVTISSISTNSDGQLYASVKAKYKYSLSYQSGDETKTHDSSDYDYAYVYLTYADKSFKIVNASSLNTYFSKYY